ncbi:hypothetical protein S83_037390, partial [Arachis hypogaea]
MRRYEVPRLAFINKLDRMGADPWKVLNQARSKLRHHSAAMQVPIGLEDDFEGLVDLVQLKAYYFRGSNGEKVVTEEVPADMEALEVEKRRELIEAVSEVDDQLAEAFLGDEPISPADLQEAIRRATIARKFVPVFMGSVFKNKATIELPLLPFDRICVIDESFYHQFVSGWYPCSQVQTPKPPRGSLGVQPLLDGVLNYLPCPIEVSSYALDQTKNEEKVELTGSLDGPLVALAFKLEEGRFGQLTYLRDQTVQKLKEMGKIQCGFTLPQSDSNPNNLNASSAFCHLPIYSPTLFSNKIISLPLPTSLATQSYQSLGPILRSPPPRPEHFVFPQPRFTHFILTINHFITFPAIYEGVIRKGEFIINVNTGKKIKVPRLVRMHSDEMEVRYIKPLRAGSPTKFEFENLLVGQAIPSGFIPAIEKGFKEPPTHGAAHAVDSSELAFKLASIHAFRQCYTASRPFILEPVMLVELKVPTEFQGAVAGDINKWGSYFILSLFLFSNGLFMIL